MKKIFLLNLFSCLVTGLFSQAYTRTEIKIPDIPGYQTLKCDFHIHTVFSDGLVWPTIRVQEAWADGLDAIAITDHIEYQPHKSTVDTNHNRAYEEAKNLAESMGLLLIPGAEITRDMPPGHLNAIFLEDAEKLDVEKWEDAVKAARRQGAFIFWNHPCWKAQQPDTTLWFDEHTFLYKNDMLHGIEVVNTDFYCTYAHRWGNKKNLSLLGNSDIHGTIHMSYNNTAKGHRPITLVFVKEKTLASIKEALENQKTVIYFKEKLIGDEEFLLPIFEQSVSIENPARFNGKYGNILIENNSAIEYHLRFEKNDKIQIKENVVLEAGKTSLIYLRKAKDIECGEKATLRYTVLNCLMSPEENISGTFEIEIE